MAAMGVIAANRRRGGGSDPDLANVVFLSGFEGGSVVDESPLAQTVTLSGTPAASSAQARFGSQSLLRTTGACSVPDHASFISGTMDFTVEGWFYFTADVYCSLLSQWRYSSSTAWMLNYEGDWLQLYCAASGIDNGSAAASAAVGSWTPTLNTWYHIAADFDGTTYRVYVDGTMIVSNSPTPITIFNSTAPLAIGNSYNSGGSAIDGFPGHIDEARITAGVARYASDGGYSVPTAAFPRV